MQSILPVIKGKTTNRVNAAKVNYVLIVHTQLGLGGVIEGAR
jgi:hypothetical protein